MASVRETRKGGEKPESERDTVRSSEREKRLYACNCTCCARGVEKRNLFGREKSEYKNRI